MSDITPEFSRLISVARLSPQGSEEMLDATPEERAALAKRFDLVELSSLKAKLLIQPGRMETITVTGKITAKILQSCVVTLDPITTHLDVAVDVTFVPATVKDEEEDSDEISDGEIETYENGKIDLGELVAQQMGISINPYPRKPNAALSVTEFGPVSAKPHPFAILNETVKNKEKTKD